MFSMGRFDPRQEEDKEQKMKTNLGSSNTKKKRKRNHSFDHSDKKHNTIHEIHETPLPETSSMDRNKKDDDDKFLNDNDDSSSVPPSSGESSSSAPSSDESDTNMDKGENEIPTLKVIAPEQKGNQVGIIKNKRTDITDERMDDFDDIPNQVDSNYTLDKQIEMAKNISKQPIRDAAKLWNLAPFLIQNLEENGFKTFFPIQALVIPDVIASERHVHVRNRDICVSAPTGSGKTLAFVLPVLNALAGRRVKRLRALVVLPSRDLGELKV